ncbi:hypothetical protein QUF80_09360 [Desulfococcaceae bacterium HSG8]|nr:hypothetical protein [Desulfococcaceae bacterium HSG8]
MPNSRKETGIETLRYICHTSDALSWKDMETKLIQAFDKDRKGDIMTIADELRMEGKIRGEIEGEIKTYRELMKKKLSPGNWLNRRLPSFQKGLRRSPPGFR